MRWEAEAVIAMRAVLGVRVARPSGKSCDTIAHNLSSGVQHKRTEIIFDRPHPLLWKQRCFQLPTDSDRPTRRQYSGDYGIQTCVGRPYELVALLLMK